MQDKPLFNDIVSDFLEFIEGSELIIHNAPFDVGFLSAELKRINWSKKLQDYCSVLDTLVLARNKHPGQRNSLDALCKRYDVDNSNRQLHGALLDAEILAGVYLAMTGGQINLFIEDDLSTSSAKGGKPPSNKAPTLMSQSPVIFAVSEEMEAHDAFLAFLAK